jgi:hypothetical protein
LAEIRKQRVNCFVSCAYWRSGASPDSLVGKFVQQLAGFGFGHNIEATACLGDVRVGTI